jgi:hypothetical protein
MRRSHTTRLGLLGASVLFVVYSWGAAVPVEAADANTSTTCQGTTSPGSATTVPAAVGGASAPTVASAGDGKSSHPGGLAFTGLPTGATLLAAGLLIGTGLLVVVASRRRRSNGTTSLAILPVGLAIAHSILPVAGQPTCGPPVVLPESPFVVLLPVAAAAVFAATWRIARDRSS